MRIFIIGNLLGKAGGFSISQGEVLANLLNESGYQVRSVSNKVNQLVRLFDIIWNLYKSRGWADLVVLEVYSGLYFFVPELVVRICKLFRIPCIAVLHGGALGTFAKAFPRRTKVTLSKATHLVSPSRFLADELADLGLPIDVIPNVVDLQNYPFRLRSSITPNLIWMRSFHEIYDPEMAVLALEKLRRRFPTSTLVMAGADKGLEFAVRKLVGDLGLTACVRFTGFLDHAGKIAEMGKANIFLNTNRVDNMPVSIIEARAFGLPVIATDVGGLSHMILDREDGLLVPVGDVESMVRGIEELLTNQALCERISRKGRERSDLSAWQTVRMQWEDMFTKITSATLSEQSVSLISE